MKMLITKKEFLSYESIRQSGITNMFDVRTVVDLSGGILTREKCIGIMEQYSELRKKYMK